MSEVQKDFIHLNDVVNAIFKCINYNGEGYEAFNLVMSESTSGKGLV
tara:strand:- start:625 stop:765 length:141 start_codon:yes stop_codon:yes gene_type:complete